MTIKLSKPSAAEAGFTLLEVLIAMSILAIGVLGMASLQGIALKLGDGGMQRSQASDLAFSILDAMRVNYSNLSDYNRDFLKPGERGYECEPDLAISGDLEAWQNDLACTLPQGNGEIRVVNNTVTVTVKWDSTREQTEDELAAGKAENKAAEQLFVVEVLL